MAETETTALDTQDSHPYVVPQNQRDRQDRFLAAFRVRGTVSKAAEDAGIARETCYDWLQNDSQGFKDRMEEARRGFTETLENMMMDRLSEPQGNRGSDVLLMFSLNANNPSKYRPNTPQPDDAGKDIIKALRAGGRRKIKARETVREIEIEEVGE